MLDWPDDTLELMMRQLAPCWPFKPDGLLGRSVRYPVSIPVAGPDVELYCWICDEWNLVADWEERPIPECPNCGAPPPPGHEHGEHERLAPTLFTIVLPVSRRHYTTVFDPDPESQAVVAIRACRMARRQAGRYGFEVIG